MLAVIIIVQSAASGAIMKEVVAQKRKDIARRAEPELTLVHRGDPDPRLVELVRLLARRAAHEWYEHITEECRSKRS
jgi:hypothetical protein